MIFTLLAQTTQPSGGSDGFITALAALLVAITGLITAIRSWMNTNTNATNIQTMAQVSPISSTPVTKALKTKVENIATGTGDGAKP